jgi:hypothetical protein
MYKQWVLGACAVLVFCTIASGQTEGINIFGYFQAQASNYESIPSQYSSTTPVVRTMNLGITQANVFLTKNFSPGLSSFVNFEFVNNFSSDRQWGSFNLQEAFLRYEYDETFTLKAGYFIPKFNAMYEVYNRTPLFPYLLRPLMYETQFGQLTNIFNALPSRALLQVSGVMPAGDLGIDYALYIGNPGEAFIESRNVPINPAYVPVGQNATNYKSFGGRLGLKYDVISCGVSGVLDKDNKRSFVIDLDGTQTESFGDLNRQRYGADFSASWNNFTLTSELLMTTTSLTQEQKDSLQVWANIPNSQVGINFDVKSYFVSLQYDATQKVSVYGMYELYNDNFMPFLLGLNGYGGWTGGVAYHLSDEIVLKGQYARLLYTFLTEVGDVDLTDTYIVAGLSIAF